MPTPFSLPFRPDQSPIDLPPNSSSGPEAEPPGVGNGLPDSDHSGFDVATPASEEARPDDAVSPEDGPPGFFNPAKMIADMDAAHREATRRNQTDWADKPSQQTTNQHFIDVRFGQRKREIGELRDQVGEYLADWLGTPQPNGEPRTQRPPSPIWTMLSYEQRHAVDRFLVRNAGASRDFQDRWIDIERKGRLAKMQLLPSQSQSGAVVDPFLTEVDVRDNAEQGKAAVKEFLARTDPRGIFKEQVRLYAKGIPGYMVADVLITGGGVTHIGITEFKLCIVEVKSGQAILSKAQLAILSKAVRDGQVYLVNSKVGEDLGNIKPYETLAEQRIIPVVSVIGGNQEAIKRQLRDFGVEYIPKGGGRLGRIRGGFIPE